MLPNTVPQNKPTLSNGNNNMQKKNSKHGWIVQKINETQNKSHMNISNP